MEEKLALPEAPHRGRPFLEAGVEISRRLLLVDAAGWAKRTAVPVFAVLLGLVLLNRFFGGGSGVGFLSVLAVLVWAAGCFGLAWWKRPTGFVALSFWDAKAGRGDAFASAAFFEEKGDLTTGEALHLERSGEVLPSALSSLAKELPFPEIRWEPVLPVLFILFAFSPLASPPLTPEQEELTDAMKEAARMEAERLATDNVGEELTGLEGLSEEEKKRLAELQEAIEQTADGLDDPAGKSAEEVLDELEKRARETEKLAKRLGEDGDAWASDALLNEMLQHADTAGLADAVKETDADKSADEAEKLSDQLKDPGLTAEVRERMREALARSSAKATAEDHGKPLGEHVEGASGELAKQSPASAGTEFSELAKKFRKIAQREQAQEELEKLAEKLREAGASIAGQHGHGMEKLAGASGQGHDVQGEMAQTMPMSQSQGMGDFENSELPVPGLSQGNQQMMMPLDGDPGKPGSSQKGAMMAPVPGTAAEGAPVVFAPQQGKGSGKQILLTAPIPGTKPDKVMLVPGAGGAGGMTRMGGLQAGNGSVALGGESTEALGAHRQGLVGAQINRGGESSVRAVEGSARNELAGRSRKAVAVDFINTEEAALDEKPLPLSRKEHVRRYFNALRKQFETP